LLLAACLAPRARARRLAWHAELARAASRGAPADQPVASPGAPSSPISLLPRCFALLLYSAFRCQHLPAVRAIPRRAPPTGLPPRHFAPAVCQFRFARRDKTD